MDDEPEEIGIPEWVVTFGDMMSLLLTFFIMLVSLSEIKEEEKFQAMTDSIQQSFGYQKTVDALTPGDSRPRKSTPMILSTTGRAKKKDTAKGGVPEKAPTGEEPRVRVVRPGQTTAVGAVIFFELGSDVLSRDAITDLAKTAGLLKGKPQKIEVRGHVSAKYAARTEGTDEAVMLSFRRAAAVRRHLIDVNGLESERFRVSSAGETEPMHRTGESNAISQNPRVEVFLLDETVEDLNGSADERNSETINETALSEEQA